MAGRGHGCGCCPGHLNEDNSRFLLLTVLLMFYLLGGAAVFCALERAPERLAQHNWGMRLTNFSRQYNVSVDELKNFLRHYEQATMAGIHVDSVRQRWDLMGAFYFVATVVTTIGFGMTTPTTIPGKIFLIFYGLVGCASTILFFNIFLERLVTLIGYSMKLCYHRKLQRQRTLPQGDATKSSTHLDSLSDWKPSVYHVMLILFLASLLISCCASFMYTSFEGWTYLDSLYFCFVAFSTIGFGDLVSSQRAKYDSHGLYGLANFIFILMGVCCIYSLFTLIAILIRKLVNWILQKLKRRCGCQIRPRFLEKRRNTVMPDHVQNRSNTSIDSDGAVESDANRWRLSGEMNSMDVLNYKSSLTSRQRQSHNIASHLQHHANSGFEDEFSGGVGALAIMNNRLAETSGDR